MKSNIHLLSAFSGPKLLWPAVVGDYIRAFGRFSCFYGDRVLSCPGCSPAFHSKESGPWSSD